MGIKEANARLLLGKIRKYLDAQPEEKKKSKRFSDAEKALTRLEKLFTEQEAGLPLSACRKDRNVIYG